MTPFTCSGLVARWIALAGASAISDAPVHHSCGCRGRLGTCIECVFKFNRPMLYALGASGLLGVCGVSGHNITGTNNVPILQVRYTRDTDGHLSQYTMLLLKRETALYPKRAVLVHAATSTNLTSRLLSIVQLELLALYLHPGGKTQMAGLLPSVKPDGSSTTRINC
ncbi:uncharacterized protein B0H18DRAFT_526391 [Fomitopsis serialis]|uniref:uncharacterized protein n=1 Tax=Fomitopsis serialis TaxID=139415 RepID=UPI002007ECBD|nr:uncharacterized protein B0H18DRAFT_526391 [Neoantrodia serialis]KAH9922053.1 hypothetical protein B0H18DRAFT_526391 [Neoantrodia serialis]